ncbi:class IV adenylate cyclase [soil metagenome]
MARNIEIKARITSIEALLPLAQSVADHAPELILQDDTFFACAHGRLKLRAFADGRGVLIAYQRADATGPKTSDYLFTPTADPSGLRDTLTRALGTAGRVVKQRTLLLAGRTRIHLDRVEGLGDFLELEVVLRDGESEAQGTAEAHALLAHLQIDASQFLAGAYVDLLQAKSSP